MCCNFSWGVETVSAEMCTIQPVAHNKPERDPSTMLKKISIQNFKSIHNIEDLELGQVNVFIGANGSGKSNLLEALGFINVAMEGRITSQDLWRRGIRLSPEHIYRSSLRYKENHTSTENTKIQFLSTHDSPHLLTLYHELMWQNGKWDVLSTPIIDDNLGVTFAKDPRFNEEWRSLMLAAGMALISQGKNLDLIDIKAVSEHLNQLISYIQHEDNHEISKLNEDDRKLIEQLRNIVANLPNRIQAYTNDFANDYVIYSPTTPVLRGMQPDIVQLEPVGLLGGQLAEAVDELLDLENEMFGDCDLDDVLDLLEWTSGFDVTTPSRDILAAGVPTLRSLVRFKDMWMHDGRNQISGYDASEGALYVLFMLVLALHPKVPKFFAVDNFDQALNPRLARALIQKFCKLILELDSHKQVLLTTHNPLVLDGLNLADDRIRLFTVDRNYSTKGATQVRRIQVSEEIINASQDGLPLSKLWVMGRFGGVPNM